MTHVVWTRRRFPLYLVALMLGMMGVLFSRLLDDSPALQSTVVLLSVALPLLAVGRMAAYLRMGRSQRIFLVAGVIMLITGAVVTVSGLADSLSAQDSIAPYVGDVSRWLGLGSLTIGLLVIVYLVIHAGEAIEEIGERFRNLAEHMNEGLLLAAPDGTITLVNDRLLELTGLVRDELVGYNARDVAAKLKLLDNAFHGLGEGPERRPSEYELVWQRDGKTCYLWVSASPIFNSQGEVAGTFATFRDISEQTRMAKRLEKYTHGLQQLVEDRTRKLQQSEERYRNLLLHMNEGFLTVDVSLTVRFANRRACDLLETPSEQIVGASLFRFIEPVDQGKLLDLFEHVRSQQFEQVRDEVTLLGAHHRQIPAVAAIAAIRPAEEGGARYSIVLTDVRRLKGMQEQLETRASELQAANYELKELDRAKDIFLSNVSHELRTPLSTIRGYVEMLRTQALGVLAPKQEKAAEVMDRNVRRLGSLIDEMIEFSRMEIRGVQLRWSIVDLRRLIEDSTSSMEPQAQTRNIQLLAELDACLPPVWGDPQKLTQVMGILLSNAIKFSPDGSAIHIIASAAAGGRILIAVRDEGIGIPDEHHKRVFEKFYQVDSSTSRRYEGTGIGLSIAKSIAEGHGGDITLESEPDQGSTFTVVLPESAALHPMPEEEHSALPAASVLLISERAGLRDALSGLLDVAGCRVAATGNAYEGIRHASQQRPHIIVLDDAVSDPDVPAVVRRLGETGETAAIPVLVLGSPGIVDEISGLPVHVLRKPFPARMLVAEIKRLIEAGAEPGSHQALFAPFESQVPRVLVADSDRDLLEWIESALRHRGIRSRCATERSDILALVAESRPELILADADGREWEGESFCATLISIPALRDIPIYAMTGLPSKRPPVSGAAGMLRKPFSINDVLAILEELHASATH